MALGFFELHAVLTDEFLYKGTCLQATIWYKEMDTKKAAAICMHRDASAKQWLPILVTRLKTSLLEASPQTRRDRYRALELTAIPFRRSKNKDLVPGKTKVTTLEGGHQ